MKDPEFELNRLWAAYRDATPDPEPDPGFAPRLWLKIDARRGFRVQLRSLSRAILAGACAFGLLAGTVLIFSPFRSSQRRHETYIDALGASNDSETFGYAALLQGEPGDANNR